MGIFSFGKKGADPSERSNGRSRSARSEDRRRDPIGKADAPPDAARVRARTPRASRSVGQEAMLDPTLPEKQRARRRLVGAIALVMAAVIVLPMVLDSHPKPVTDDIAISIPEQAESAGRDAARHDATGRHAWDGADKADADPGDSGDTSDGNTATNAANAAAPDSPPPPRGSVGNAGSTAPSTTAPVPAPAVTRGAVKQPNTGAAVSIKDASNSTQKLTKAATSPAPSDQSNANRTAAASLPPTPATPGSRYVVQLGSFTSDTAAREWVGKLKNIGVPAYIEHVKQADGGDQIMLRAGPFADRKIAQAAVQKVRQAGLSQAGR